MSSDVYDKPPTTSQLDYAALVRRAWGDEWLKKDIVYQFGQRRFQSTDDAASGIYRPPTGS